MSKCNAPFPLEVNWPHDHRTSHPQMFLLDTFVICLSKRAFKNCSNIWEVLLAIFFQILNEKRRRRWPKWMRHWKRCLQHVVFNIFYTQLPICTEKQMCHPNVIPEPSGSDSCSLHPPFSFILDPLNGHQCQISGNKIRTVESCACLISSGPESELRHKIQAVCFDFPTNLGRIKLRS